MENYNQWLSKASDDIKWAFSSLEGEVFYGVCFASQQAVEKALKAFLIFHGRKLRKIHDLRALLEECSQIDENMKQIWDQVIELNPYYIETRYPSFDDDMFTKEKAEEAYKQAKHVLEFVKQKLSTI